MKLDDIAKQLADYAVVLEPDENRPEWWAGAPSVVRARDGTFYLAARMRHGSSPKGRRGYEIRILKSSDGRHFEPIHRIRREDAGVTPFEDLQDDIRKTLEDAAKKQASQATIDSLYEDAVIETIFKQSDQT